MTTKIPLIAICAIAGLIATVTLEPVEGSSHSNDLIPAWIKNNALWWAEGKISDNEYATALTWLAEHRIITIPGSACLELSEKIDELSEKTDELTEKIDKQPEVKCDIFCDSFGFEPSWVKPGDIDGAENMCANILLGYAHPADRAEGWNWCIEWKHAKIDMQTTP